MGAIDVNTQTESSSFLSTSVSVCVYAKSFRRSSNQLLKHEWTTVAQLDRAINYVSHQNSDTRHYTIVVRQSR